MLQNLTRKVVTGSLVVLSSIPLLAQSAMAQKDNYRVINGTNTDIVRLYISESSNIKWSLVTGLGRLWSGYSASIHFNNPSPDVCRYDIRAVFADGDVLEGYNIDVCSGDFYRFYSR